MKYYDFYSSQVVDGGDDRVKHYIDQLADGFSWKIVLSILSSLIGSMEYFYGSLLWTFLGLFVLDFITGIMKSVKLCAPITSRRLRDSVFKLGAYMVLLTALIITSKVDNSFAPLVPVTYYYYIFTEFKSVAENAEILGIPVPKFLSSKIKSRSKKSHYSE